MQNVKGDRLKIFFSVVTFLTYLLCMASVCIAEGADDPPQVFLGNTPTAITVQRGMPVEIPIFFVGGTCVNKEVELYVFRIEDGGYVCLGPDGWESDYATALEDVKPLFHVPGLPEYIYLCWRAFENSQSLSNFDLWVCVDDQVDGTLTGSSLYCGHQSIIIEEGDNDTGTGGDDGSGSGGDNGSGGGGPPQVFVGNTPTAITVQRGMPVEIPIFFVGGTCVNKEVELYVFRIEDGGYVCLGPDGWESDYVTALEDFKPLGVASMPEYVYVDWPALDNSQSLSDFDLCVCVDDQIDGIFTVSSYCCGCQSIIIEEVDDSNGDDNDTGTGDDSGSGVDDGTGDGDSPIPTPPPFPDLGGDSGSSCNSLEYTPEGTTFSQSSISKSLELGESEQITLLTSACGSSVTVSSVYKASGGEWLSVSSGGGSKVILNLNAGVTGLQAGSTYTGTVTVVAGGITDNMSVTLRVLGQCDPTSASVAPTSLTFQADVGGQSPSAQTIRVKDNCGDAVYATVLSKPSWLALAQTGTGVFSASCVESYLDEEGSYSDSLTLQDGDYDQQHSVSVTLEVTNTSPPPPDDSVVTVTSGHIDYYDIGAGQTRYFKFVAGVSDCWHPIRVDNTPKADQPRTVHVLIKRGSKPTIADFERTWQMAPSQYGCNTEQWIPAKPGAENLYWKYNIGSQTERVEIAEPMETNTFYIMLYNNGTSNVRDQRLIVFWVWN